ncbi:MAG: hypothetical protein LC799_25605, partial [Actinobacteria bacterium]|nr:hypothetical protein [Actinomycetota bacterium]
MTVTTSVFQRIALVSAATTMVAALISPAPPADAIPRDQATVGSLSMRAHQDHHEHSASPGALAALTLPSFLRGHGKAVADQAPGGRAVAHYADGVLVRSRAVQGKA